MADVQVERIELTDEEKAVLRECRINSVYFRGFPLGAGSVLLLRQALKYGYLPYLKKYSSLCYTGLFGLGFLSGIASYQSACVEKIMKLENSRLADQVRANMSRNRGAYKGHWEPGSIYQERDVDEVQGKGLSSNRSSETMGRPPAEDHSSAIVTSSPDESGEERPTPPSLYFDVDKAKENKYTSYAELRKKHRERWTPPNMPSSSPSRSEQPRHRQEREPNSKTGSSDAPMSWFDMDNSGGDRGDQEGDRESGQRNNRPSYRQGSPPRKNKYGDVIEG